MEGPKTSGGSCKLETVRHDLFIGKGPISERPARMRHPSPPGGRPYPLRTPRLSMQDCRGRQSAACWLPRRAGRDSRITPCPILETGFLAIFLAPRQVLPKFSQESAPSLTMLWLCRWLLFRLMFMSGAVKLLSRDAAWWHLGALTFHYETQPLPTWIGWYAHQLPVWFQEISLAIMFGIELGAPFLILCGRRPRQVACGAFALLMQVTGPGAGPPRGPGKGPAGGESRRALHGGSRGYRRATGGLGGAGASR